MASEINAELMLEIKSFLEGIKKSQNAATKFSKKGKDGAGSWGAALKKVARALVAVGKAAMKAAAVVAGIGAALATALGAGVKSALDLGGKFSDIAAQIGTTAGKAQILASAFEANGMSADDAAATINKMQKSIGDAVSGSATAMDAFSNLGLDPDELLKSDPAAAFQQVINGLSGIDSATERTAVAMQVFGKSGAKLNVLLNDPEAMKNAAATIGGQADLLDEHAADFDRASDILGQMGTKTQGFFVGVGAQIVEQIMPALEFINSIDLSGIGQRFGAALSNALNTAVAIFKIFSGMSLAEMAKLFGVTLRLGVSKAVNVLWAGLQAGITGAVSLFLEGIKNSLALLSILSTASFWSGMRASFIAISKVFVASIIKGFAGLITQIKNNVKGGGAIFGDSDEALRDVGESIGATAQDDFKKAGADLAPAFEKIGERMRETGKAVANTVGSSFQNAKNLVNTGGDEAAIGSIASHISAATSELKSNIQKKAETGAAGRAGEGDDGGGRYQYRIAETQFSTCRCPQHDYGSERERHYCNRGREDFRKYGKGK